MSIIPKFAHMKNKYFAIKSSKIHGVGVFARRAIIREQMFSLNILDKLEGWQGFNHSCTPNVICAAEDPDSGCTHFIALRYIEPGEELTISYSTFRLYNNELCNCPIHRSK